MKKISNIIIIIILFVLPFFVIVNFFESIYFTIPNSCQDKEATPILNNVELKQSFVAEKENLNKIAIKTATYGKFFNLDKLYLTITDKNGEVITKEKSNFLKTRDNKFWKIRIPSEKIKKNELYFIKINSLKEDKNTLAVWTTEKNCYEGSLIINNKKKKADIVMQLSYEEEDFNSSLKKLENRISQFKPFFLKKRYIKLLIFSNFFILTISMFILKKYFVEKK